MAYLPSKKFIGVVLGLFVVWAGFTFWRAQSFWQGGQTLVYVAKREATTGPAPTKPAEFSFKQFQLEDFTQAQSDGPDAIHQYGLDLKDALAPLENPDRPNELKLMLSALDKGSIDTAKSEVDALAAGSQAYEEAIAGLLKVSVPNDPAIAQANLELVNTLERMKETTADMAQVLQDPFRAIASGNEFAKASNDLAATLTKLDQSFADHHITFAAKEKINLTVYVFQ